MSLFSAFPDIYHRSDKTAVPEWMQNLARPVNWLEDHGPLGRSEAHDLARAARDVAVVEAIDVHGAGVGDVAAVMDASRSAVSAITARTRRILAAGDLPDETQSGDRDNHAGTGPSDTPEAPEAPEVQADGAIPGAAHPIGDNPPRRRRPRRQRPPSPKPQKADTRQCGAETKSGKRCRRLLGPDGRCPHHGRRR